MKVVEDETGAEYFLHAPSALGSVSLYHVVLGVGGVAKTLYKVFKSISPEAEEILEDLPWE